MDRLQAMQTFADIVDAGSLTAAAERRGCSVPTVVRTLAALETLLGTRLLRRTTRRMSLTAEGREYLGRCRRILADVDDAEQAVSARQTELRGVIRLTAPVLFGQRHVAPALSSFLAGHPRVGARLLLLDRVVDMVEEGLDLALRIGPLPDSGMAAMPVGTMRRVVCAAPETLARHGCPHAPDALGRMPCVVHGAAEGAQHWRFASAHGSRTLAVDGPLVCNQAAAVADAAAAGLGFAQLLHYQVAPLLETGALVTILEDHEIPPVPVSLVYPEARLVTSRVRALARHLHDRLRADLADQ